MSNFLERLNEIYNDIHLRVNLENWLELMNMPVVWNIESFSVIEGELFDFIVEHKYLPPEVWDLFETNYCWSKNEIDFCNKHEEGKVADIIKIIKNPYKPSYNFIINIDKKNLERYLDLRQEAVEKFHKNNYLKAIEIIEEAFKIYSKDPELLELHGDILMQNKVLKPALVCFKQALEIDYTKVLCKAKIGAILNLIKQYNKAIPYLESYIKKSHNKEKYEEKLALYNLGYSYYYKKNYSKAKYYFEESIKFEWIDNSADTLANKYLKNLEARIQGERVRKIKPNKIRLKKILKKYEVMEKGSKEKNEVNIKRFKIICITIAILVGVIRIGFSINDNSKHASKRDEVNHLIYQI